jgi:phage shock protein PspC (stress-responsive transcriptional regulator)
MPTAKPSLFTRDDTFFGICEGLGEDLGFNPLFLRLALPVPLFFFPVETVVGYFAAGVVVLATRLAFPHPVTVSSQAEPVAVNTPDEEPQLPLAA